MPHCDEGHVNVENARFCVTCGRALRVVRAPSVAGPDVPAGRIEWPPPAARALPASPFGPRPVPPPPGPVAAPPGRRWAVGVGAIVVVGLLAAALALAVGTLRETGGQATTGAAEGSGALVVVREGSADGPGSLHLLEEGQPIEGSTPFATGAEIVPIAPVPVPSTLDIDPEAPAGPLPTLVTGGGGAVVGWQDDAGTTVALVAPSTGQTFELLEVDGDVDVWVDAEGAHLLAAREVVGGWSCWAGAFGLPLQEVVQADRCGFSASGRVLAYDEPADDGDGFDVTTFDPDGRELASFATDGRPRINRSGFLVADVHEGAITQHQADTGEVVTEVEEPGAEFIDWTDDGGTVFGRIEDGVAAVAAATLGPGSRITPNLVEGEIVSAAPVGDRSFGLAVVEERGATTIGTFDLEVGRLQPLLSEPGLRSVVFDGPEPHVVAWDERARHVWFGPALGQLEMVGSLPALVVADEIVFDPVAERAYVIGWAGARDGGRAVPSLGLHAVDRQGVATMTEGWDEIRLVAPDDDEVVAVLASGGSELLASIRRTGAERRLDTARSIAAPAVVDGWVRYTAYGDAAGSGAEVRAVHVAGGRPAAAVYEGAAVVQRSDGTPGLWVEPVGRELPTMADPAVCTRYPDGNQLDEQVPVDQRADEWCVGEVGTTGVLTVEVEGGAPLVLEVRAGDEVLATSGEPRAGARLEVELDGRWQHLAIATPDDVEGEVRLRTSWTPTGD